MCGTTRKVTTLLGILKGSVAGRCSLRRTLIVPVLILVLLGPVASVSAGAAASAEDAVTTRTILSLHIADSPPPPAFIALVRTVLPLGAVNRNVATDGVWCIAVESGALSLESPESDDGMNAGFLRAADAPPSYRSSTVGGQSSQTVVPGEALVFTDPRTFTIGNAGADSSTYLGIVFASRPTLGFVRHITMDLIVVDPLALAQTDVLPADPVEIRLEEIDLGPSATLAIPAFAGPRVLMVVSGTATTRITAGTVTLRSDVGTDSPTPMSSEQALVAGTPTTIDDRDEVIVQAGASGQVNNSGPDAVTLWSLSVVSVIKSTYSPGS
jgi:hypothetical protein